jgi:multidrug transporter EmrE-like cation transporter
LKYFYIAGTVFFTVFGQLILKYRIELHGSLPEGFSEKILFLFRLFLDAYVVCGFVSAFIASLFWMAVMTEADLSFAYPIITAGLTLLTVLLAIILLGEPLTAPKIIGVILILCGLVVMQYS